MFKLETIVALLADLIRVLVVDGGAELVRKLAGQFQFRSTPRGMAALRRHIHRRTRKRLLGRLSTGT